MSWARWYESNCYYYFYVYTFFNILLVNEEVLKEKLNGLLALLRKFQLKGSSSVNRINYLPTEVLSFRLVPNYFNELR